MKERFGGKNWRGHITEEIVKGGIMGRKGREEVGRVREEERERGKWDILGGDKKWKPL